MYRINIHSFVGDLLFIARKALSLGSHELEGCHGILGCFSVDFHVILPFSRRAQLTMQELRTSNIFFFHIIPINLDLNEKFLSIDIFLIDNMKIMSCFLFGTSPIPGP